MSQEEGVDLSELTRVERRSGDMFFATVMLLIGLFLLSQLTSQTKWFDGVHFLKQPRFWPSLCLGGYLIFSIAYFIQSLRDKGGEDGDMPFARWFFPTDELINWVKPLEFGFYFLIYVLLVPRIGYLIATLIFCPLMTVRTGYRGRKIILISMASAIVIVLFFKTLLQVKLPAGQLYDLFPEIVRSVLIRYF